MMLGGFEDDLPTNWLLVSVPEHALTRQDG
jgi:hypothetical protein